MAESILLSVRPDVDVYEEDDHFDDRLIKEINAAFGVLYQLGVGPKSGFRITDDTETWSDFTNDEIRLEMVKDYVSRKVQMVFDPPQSSILMEALKASIAEYEWRLSVMPDFIREDI